MATIKKIIVGFVVQTYENGSCVEQEFVEGEDVSFENECGKTLDESDLPDEMEDYSCEMLQPKLN